VFIARPLFDEFLCGTLWLSGGTLPARCSRLSKRYANAARDDPVAGIATHPATGHLDNPDIDRSQTRLMFRASQGRVARRKKQSNGPGTWHGTRFAYSPDNFLQQKRR
jgi:hypothetical protein